MSDPSHSTSNTATSGNDVAEAEALKTKQAAAKIRIEVADVMSPETIVVDEPPPAPNYPLHRVLPQEPIVLANIDPNTSEHYKRRSTSRRNLSISTFAWKNYKSDSMQRTSTAC